jgi:hypothetical protein
MSPGLGFFDAAPGVEESEEDSEDDSPTAVEAAPEEPATAPVPAELVPVEATEEVLRRAEAKRKRGDLLSPDEAAALVSSSGASYLLAEGDDEQAAAKRAAFIGTDGSRTAQVADSVAAYLLAGGAKQLKALEQASGCRVLVDRGEKGRHADDTTTRRVTLVGSDAAVREGERRLHEVILQSGNFINRVLRINAAQAGKVIGRGGATIKRLQTATGTLITVSASGQAGAADAPRTVSIKGHPHQVDECARLVYAFLRDPEALEMLIQEAAAASVRVGHPAGAASSYGDGAAYVAAAAPP